MVFFFFFFFLFFFFFFFQAEDGIRDFHVTGVQTCALPICHGGGGHARATSACVTRTGVTSASVTCTGVSAVQEMATAAAEARGPECVEFLAPHQRGRRSEERRVGKERSSRGSAYQ